MSGRPCTYCGIVMGERRSVQCGAVECSARYQRERTAKRQASARRRYAEDAEYRSSRIEKMTVWRSDPENREKKRECDRTRYERDPAAFADNWRKRKARVLAATVVPFSSTDLQLRLSMYAGCWICGDPAWSEVDHVKPLSKGGPHMLSNLRPACSPCNRKKSAAWPFLVPSRKAA